MIEREREIRIYRVIKITFEIKKAKKNWMITNVLVMT